MDSIVLNFKWLCRQGYQKGCCCKNNRESFPEINNEVPNERIKDVADNAC